MRKTEFAFWTFLMMAGLAGVTTVLNVTNGNSATSPNAEVYRQLDLFGDVFERVRSDYVEKPEDTMLIENAINGMLSSLDPHSSYLSPKNFKDMQVQTRGEFGGLGIEVTMENGVIKVVSPIDDTPASKAGILANDLITHLDNEQINGLTLEQAVEKMRGPVNTPINLTVIRKGREEPFDIKVTRDVIRINPVKARAEDDVAYIKVSTFNEQTHAMLVKSMDDMKKEIGPKLRGYIIDLRNNPGGLLDQAISVSDDFLEQGAIVLTKGRNNEETQRSQARPGDIVRRQAGRGADQRRFSLGIRNRGRRSAGPQARNHHRHALVRQGLGPDDHSAGHHQRRHPSHNGALLHALEPFDPGQGHRS